MQVAADSGLRPGDDPVDEDDDTLNEQDSPAGDGDPPEAADDVDRAPAARSRKRVSGQRWATLLGVVLVVALSALLGWLGFRVHHAQHEQAQRSQFLQAARQGALNLTTIDWQRAEADVRRIMDGATGEFYDDFDKRSKAFIEVLKQAKATTVGTITDAGLESETADTAQALVAVSVQTSNAGEPEQVPRAWRMRIYVQKVGGQVKVSNVGFVP